MLETASPNRVPTKPTPMPLPEIYARVERHVPGDRMAAPGRRHRRDPKAEARAQRGRAGAQLSDARDFSHRRRHCRRQPRAGARGGAHRCRRDRAGRRPFHGRDRQAAEPGEDGADPGPQGRLLARRVDHRRRCPADARAPSGRAGRHLCQHLGRGEGRERHLLHLGQRQEDRRGARRARRVIMLPDEYLARNIAAQTKVKIIAWKGHCEVHERFTAEDVQRACAKAIRASSCWRIPNARPRSSPNATSPARPRRWPIMSGKKRPARVVLLTECSMSDNVALQYPDLDFVRPCNLCPHMKRITLRQHPPCARNHDARGDRRPGDRRAARAARSSACWHSADRPSVIPEA